VAIPRLPGIEADNAPGERLRHQAGEILETGDFRLEFENDGAALGLQYTDSPCIEPENSAPAYDPNHYASLCAVGCRAPHVELPNGHSSLDLYGRGFCLLRLGPDAPNTETAERIAESLGVPVEVTSVETPSIHALHGFALVLVRPDGIVAWRGNRLPDDLAAWIDRVRGA